MDAPYGCIEKKPDGNSTRMLQAILNKSWKQHPAKQQLYYHFPTTAKASKANKKFGTLLKKKGRTHKWLSPKDPFTRTSQCWPTSKTLPITAGSSLQDKPETMDDRDRWGERIREIRACSPTSCIHICIEAYFIYTRMHITHTHTHTRARTRIYVYTAIMILFNQYKSR